MPDDDLLSRARMLTIIGAESFHGPVRDGKGWFRLAMVIRHKAVFAIVFSSGGVIRERDTHRSDAGRKPRSIRSPGAVKARARESRVRVSWVRGYWTASASQVAWTDIHLARQGNRVKPHGQLVLVSLTCYHASTPSLSTSWSRTTLQGGQASREISSSGEFPA